MPTAHIRKPRDYIQGAAILCCRLVRYLAKHRAKMLASGNVSTADLAAIAACIDSLVACAENFCKLKNSDQP